MHFWEISGEVAVDGTDPYFGIGVQHMISDRLGLGAGFTSYRVDLDDGPSTNIDVLAARLTYLL